MQDLTTMPYTPWNKGKPIGQKPQQHLKQHDTDILPVVFPLIFYISKNSELQNRDIFGLFAEHGDLARSVLLQPITLIDIGNLSVEPDMDHPWVNLLEMVYRHRAIRDFVFLLKQLKSPMVYVDRNNGQDLLHCVFNYIIHEKNDRYYKADELNNYIRSTFNVETGEKMKTIAEQMEARGETRGRRAGFLEAVKTMTDSMKKAGIDAEKVNEITRNIRLAGKITE